MFPRRIHHSQLIRFSPARASFYLFSLEQVSIYMNITHTSLVSPCCYFCLFVPFDFLCTVCLFQTLKLARTSEPSRSPSPFHLGCSTFYSEEEFHSILPDFMHRLTSLALLSRRLTIRCALVSSDATASNLPNPCIAMAPDSNHIVCYHPEKPHPYDQTRPIDRTDSSFARVSLACISFTDEH